MTRARHGHRPYGSLKSGLLTVRDDEHLLAAEGGVTNVPSTILITEMATAGIAWPDAPLPTQ